MVIVDTSVWINHLRKGHKHLEKLLLDAEVICYEFIIGELACGNLKNRNETISLLQSLPHSPTLDHLEFLYFIDKHRPLERGIGFVDVHLLTSAQLARLPLWAADNKLRAVSKDLRLQYSRR